MTAATEESHWLFPFQLDSGPSKTGPSVESQKHFDRIGQSKPIPKPLTKIECP